MNKLIIAFLTAMFILPVALACTSPVIYNEFGTPINLYGSGILIIKSSDFPEGSSWVKYPLNVSNRNSQPLTINFTPAQSLALVVKPTSATLAPGEQKQVDLDIDIRKDKAGQIYISGNCADGLPFGEGAINLGIDNTDNNQQVQQCNNNILSCGLYPNCQDLTKVDNKCVDGYLRDYWCTSNVPQYKDSCSNVCCRSFLGPNAMCKTIGGVSKCVGPETTVTLNVSNGAVSKSVNFTMFEVGTNSTLSSSTITGSGNLKSSSPNVDLKGEFDNANFIFTLRNLTFSSLGTNANFVINNTNPSIGTLTVYKAFYVQLPIGTSYKNISLTIRHSDVSYRNVNSLAIYRCGNYDASAQKCNESWTKQTTVLSGGYATAEVSTFSAYMLGEPVQETTTTTTQPPSTSNYGGGSSGGSSGGGGGGAYIPPTTTTTTTLPSKPTGFYNYTPKLEIKAGSSGTFTAEFLSNYQPSLKAVKFQLVGVNSAWVAVEPSPVDEIFPADTVELTITISVPEDATIGPYPLTLQASSPSTPIRYESSLELAITPAPTTTTVIPTTTTQPKSASGIPTGLVNLVQTALVKGWPLILIAGGLAILIKLYPRGKTYSPRYSSEPKRGSKGTAYRIEDDSPDYVRLEMKGPEIKPEAKEEKKVDPKMEENRQKVIEEIRRRAMKEDKRFK